MQEATWSFAGPAVWMAEIFFANNWGSPTTTSEPSETPLSSISILSSQTLQHPEKEKREHAYIYIYIYIYHWLVIGGLFKRVEHYMKVIYLIR